MEFSKKLSKCITFFLFFKKLIAAIYYMAHIGLNHKGTYNRKMI